MKYKHPDNVHLEYVDRRDLAHRKDLFFDWLRWRLKGGVIDHYHFNNGYINTSKSPTGLPMTPEQKFWYSYLFGATYQSSMAWIFYWNFPSFENLDMNELDRWNRETMPRQKFATDTRYNKGHIVSMVQSLEKFVESRKASSVKDAFESLLVEDQMQSFHNVTDSIRTLHKFGRMTSWLFAQCLYESAGLPIAPDTMFTDDPSNVSVWNGAQFYQGLDHKTVGEHYANYKPTNQDRQASLIFEKDLMAEARERIEDPYLSYFTLETHLCQFKKLCCGRDYPGQNTGDAYNRFIDFSEKWPEVDFSAFETAMGGLFPAVQYMRESKHLMKLFEKTGQVINMHDMYPDKFPNMQLELGITKNDINTNSPIILSSIENYLDEENDGGLGKWFS